jgi:hypothetical protein
VLLDFYCTLVDLGDPVRSRGFDDFARRLRLPLGPGELYRRYVEMADSEPAEDAAAGFVPYRTSWLSAGRRVLAPFGRESAAEQFAGANADMHATAVIFPGVPDMVRALARHHRPERRTLHLGQVPHQPQQRHRRRLDRTPRHGLRQLRIVDGPDEVHLRSIARHKLSAQASPPAAPAAIRGDTLMAPAN